MRQVAFTVRFAQWIVRSWHFRQFALVLAAVFVSRLVVPGFEAFGMPSTLDIKGLDLRGHLYVPSPPPVVEAEPLPVSGPVENHVQSSSLPPNVEQDSDGSLYPKPGYVAVNPESSLDVRWHPGIPYMRFGRITNPHVSASELEGHWHPDPGYEWVGQPGAGNWSVRWVPGAQCLDKSASCGPM